MIKEWSKSWENYTALIATCLAILSYGVSTDSQGGKKKMWQSASVLMSAVSIALLMYRYSMIIKKNKAQGKPKKAATYLLLVCAILAAVGVGVALSKSQYLVMYSLFVSVLMFWVNLFNPIK
jgi:RsiW-degrading membrane proteinase PrsW (M82 family)